MNYHLSFRLEAPDFLTEMIFVVNTNSGVHSAHSLVKSIVSYLDSKYKEK